MINEFVFETGDAIYFRHQLSMTLFKAFKLEIAQNYDF